LGLTPAAAMLSGTTMETKPQAFETFEQFWPHFLSSHLKASTRWAHVGSTALGLAGVAVGLRRRSAWPLIVGAAGAAALAIGAHPLFEGNTAENVGHPF
jgi:hypothetical protein